MSVSGGFGAIEFTSEPGVTVHAAWKLSPPFPEEGPGKAAPAMLYVASENEDFPAVELTVRTTGRANPVMVVFPRGTGALRVCHPPGARGG